MLTAEQYAQVARAVGEDPRGWIEKCVSVVGKGGGVVPFKLNRAQVAVHEAMQAQREKGHPGRAMVLKARQVGISTYGCGRVLARACWGPHAIGVMVAHIGGAAERLMERVRGMWAGLPPWSRPAMEVDRREEMRFGAVPVVEGNVRVNSMIVVGRSGGRGEWRSLTVEIAHVSELAFMIDAEEVLGGLLQGVIPGPQGVVIVESTANGTGDTFHREWLRAESGASGFAPIFVPWWWMPEYTFPEPADGWDGVKVRCTGEEDLLIAEHGLTLGQVLWRRWCIGTQCQGDEERFRQEYPATAAEAFLLSGHPAFSAAALTRLYEEAVKRAETEKPREGEISEAGVFVERTGGRLKVWKMPRADGDYVVAGDPASGVEGGDASCAAIFDREREEVVALWHAHETPVVFARALVGLGRFYAEAIVCPEVSGGHGFAVVEELKMCMYPRLYMWQRVDRVRNNLSSYIGWETTWRSKGLLVDTMAWALTEHAIWIPDVETIRELLEFQYVERSRVGGQEGGDDRAMAVMIALRVHIETAMKSTGAPPRLKLPEDPQVAAVEDWADRYKAGIGIAAGRAAAEVWEQVDAAMDAMRETGRAPLTVDEWTGFPGPDEAEQSIDWEPEVKW